VLAEQASHAAEPSLAVYWPTTQSPQAASVEAVEYFPTAHRVQMLAPVLLPVFVIEPGVHMVQEPELEFVEYFPAAHFAHCLAPITVSVTEPAKHSLQYDAPDASWYFPVAHKTHSSLS
jgi:hypothetical protein